MRQLSILFLTVILVMTVSSISTGAVTDEHTVGEWQSILAVDDEQGKMTGLQLSLAINPDEYYLPVGTPVNISGELRNVFGPLGGAPVILATMTGDGQDSNVTLVTDEDGVFTFADIVNRTGPVWYRAWFEGTDRMDTNRTESMEQEIQGVLNLTPPGSVTQCLLIREEEDGQVVPEETGESFESVAFEEGEDADLNLTDDSSRIDSSPDEMQAAITLQADSDTIYPGQNVTFTGLVTGKDNTPIAYRPVRMEMAYGTDDPKPVGYQALTDRDGRYSVSFHLTGPQCPVLEAVTTDSTGAILRSEPVLLNVIADDAVPWTRTRTDTRSIDAELRPTLIRTTENITISGWFTGADGQPLSFSRLHLYWYNFADTIWDPYEPSSEIITGKDGNFAVNVTGPDMPGITYMAIISKQEQSGKPLFSRALTLTVRKETEPAPGILPADLYGYSYPDQVRVGEQAAVTFELSDPSGGPLAYEPIQIFFSDDGFTWFMNGNGNITTDGDGIFSFNETPRKEGFHYYRGLYNGTEYAGPADSGIVVLAITGGRTESPATE